MEYSPYWKMWVLQNTIKKPKKKCGKGLTCKSGMGIQFPAATDFLMIALHKFFLLFFTFISQLEIAKILLEWEDKFSYFGDSFRYNSHESHSNIQNKLDRQPLLAKVSNNPYTITNYTAVYQTIRREPPILLQSIHHTRFQRSEKTA